MNKENAIAQAAVDCGYKLHVKYGPGLMESAYESMLEYELMKRGYKVQRQVPIVLVHDELTIADAFKADLLIDECVILELKAVEKMHPVYKRQLMTYLKITGFRLGLLLNFGMATFKEGIERIINVELDD